MTRFIAGLHRLIAIGFIACLGAASVGVADAASTRVERSCSSDVRRFCPKEKKDSPSLRYCMEANGRSLSRNCVRALEDSGEIPRGYFDKN